MTPNEKDYMDRYIYQVIRRLPKAQRGSSYGVGRTDQ